MKPSSVFKVNISFQNLINEFQYGESLVYQDASISFKLSQSFFRDLNARLVNRSYWPVACRNQGMRDRTPPFLNELDDSQFYVLPYYNVTALSTDYLTAFTPDLKIVREANKLDPFPLSLNTISNATAVYIACDFVTYAYFYSQFKNCTLPTGISCILMDSYLDLTACAKVKKEDWSYKIPWLNRLKAKRLQVIQYPSMDRQNLKGLKAALDNLELSYIEHNIAPKPKSVLKKEVKAGAKAKTLMAGDYYTRAELVKHFNAKGIFTSRNTLQKIAKFFDVPRIEATISNQNPKYHLPFFEYYFKHKLKGRTRKEAVDYAWSKVML